MNPSTLLWGCAAVLAAAVGVELAWPDATVPPSAPPPLPVSARVAASPAQWDAWTQKLLARPAFAPDRRPASDPVPPAGGSATPRLAGILVNGGDRAALFTTGGDRAIVAREGARVGPFDIQAIRADEVVVTGPDGLRTLRPSFSANGGVPLGSPVPPSQHAAAVPLPSPPGAAIVTHAPPAAGVGK